MFCSKPNTDSYTRLACLLLICYYVAFCLTSISKFCFLFSTSFSSLFLSLTFSSVRPPYLFEQCLQINNSCKGTDTLQRWGLFRRVYILTVLAQIQPDGQMVARGYYCLLKFCSVELRHVSPLIINLKLCLMCPPSVILYNTIHIILIVNKSNWPCLFLFQIIQKITGHRCCPRLYLWEQPLWRPLLLYWLESCKRRDWGSPTSWLHGYWVCPGDFFFYQLWVM